MTIKETSIRFGFIVSVALTLITLVTLGIALCTPPVSGPFCKESCMEYPFTDIVSRFPRDYLWMYPAVLLTIIFVVFVMCIHYYASEEKKIFSHIGLSFSLISATALISDYFLQISVIQPSLVSGEAAGISLLTQYNPHGVFIALEEIGYILMSVVFISLVPVFQGKNKLEGAIRWIFTLSFLLIILSFVIISLLYGIRREYRFEVAAITIDWITLIVAGTLLSILFRREYRKSETIRWTFQNM
jgi:hypothetical protein